VQAHTVVAGGCASVGLHPCDRARALGSSSAGRQCQLGLSTGAAARRSAACLQDRPALQLGMLRMSSAHKGGPARISSWAGPPTWPGLRRRRP
jgi:hypothetical protein